MRVSFHTVLQENEPGFAHKNSMTPRHTALRERLEWE